MEQLRNNNINDKYKIHNLLNLASGYKVKK